MVVSTKSILSRMWCSLALGVACALAGCAADVAEDERSPAEPDVQAVQRDVAPPAAPAAAFGRSTLPDANGDVSPATWPDPGQVWFGGSGSPNCYWTCPNGTSANATAADEFACVNLCQTTCGRRTHCLLI